MFKDLEFSFENSYGGNYSISDDGLTVSIVPTYDCVFTNNPVGNNNIYFEITPKSIGNGMGIIGIGGLDVFKAGNPIIPCTGLWFCVVTTNNALVNCFEYFERNCISTSTTSTWATLDDVFSLGIISKSKEMVVYKNGEILTTLKIESDANIRDMYVFASCNYTTIAATNTFNFGATEFKYPDLAKLYVNNQMLYVDKNNAVWGVKI